MTNTTAAAIEAAQELAYVVGKDRAALMVDAVRAADFRLAADAMAAQGYEDGENLLRSMADSLAPAAALIEETETR